MLIPHWLILIFSWLIVACAGAFVLCLCFLALAWVVCKAYKASEEVLAVVGILAAFVNYSRTMLRAAAGGQEWMNDFLHPADPNWRDQYYERRWRLRNPSLYFKIVPHPEAWRWWMRCLGVKKPKSA